MDPRPRCGGDLLLYIDSTNINIWLSEVRVRMINVALVYG